MNIEAWDERAAIMEFEGGMTRFEAETKAAREQGFERWEIAHEISRRDTGKASHSGAQHVGQSEDAVPAMQSPKEEKARCMFERNVQA